MRHKLRWVAIAVIAAGAVGCIRAGFDPTRSDSSRSDSGRSDLDSTSADAGGCQDTIAVLPAYPTNGARWNDYVANDGARFYTATGAPCTGKEAGNFYQACVHGGEVRKVVATGQASCAGASIRDSLEAFDWICDDSAGAATFYSRGLREGKGLRDLVTAGAWRAMSVTVLSPSCGSRTSVASAWWSNAVAALPDSSAGQATLDQAGTIYTLAAPATTRGLLLKANGTGVVMLAGAALSWADGAPPNCGDFAGVKATTMICASPVRYTWVEGDFIGRTSGDGPVTHPLLYRGAGTTHNVVRNVRARDSAASQWGMILIDNASKNLVHDVFLNPNTCNHGVDLWASNYNVVHRVRVANNHAASWCGAAVFVQASHNTVVDVTTSASYYGVRAFHADYTTVAAVTSVNTTGAGLAFVEPWNKGYNTVHNVAVSHVTGDNAILIGDKYTTLGQLAADGAWGSCINVSDVNGTSTRLKFTGNILVGTGNPVCSMTSKGADPGLSTTNTCSNQGLSDASWRLGSSLKGSFVGGLVATDPANGSNTNGAQAYPAITDWWSFGNRFRMWGADGDAATRCTTTCRIYDWSLVASASAIRNTTSDGLAQNAPFVAGADCPAHLSGDVVLTDQAGHTYLKNAIERIGIGSGNANGLCESDERCLYTPNFGSYQGHGTLGTCKFTDGRVKGVTMYGYANNGY